MIPRLRITDKFPHPNSCDENGILAFGADLSPTRLMSAYRSGIFPWYSENDPIIWWSPDPRFVMELEDFKVSKSLKKSQKKFTCKIDYNFHQVIKSCANVKRKGTDKTWILNEIIEAYETLHALGHAHSVESYYDGELVGGLYGVVVGGVFCGESMFSTMSDASKVAYSFLIEHLKEKGFDFIDAQVYTEHLSSLGAKEISRDEFLKKLENSLKDVKEF
ncbi:MAG: leucyl/phenylalanyl-tRNA--protein transferase [Campylobacterota bacterium]|nr:leucyl/phenylalanyl-tRNA--protein transferase [Campylobacterota bacterium]